MSSSIAMIFARAIAANNVSFLVPLKPISASTDDNI